MNTNIFERDLTKIPHKKVSIWGVKNKYMERYVCFALSKMLKENLLSIKIKIAFCKLLNLYQFPNTIKKINIKKCSNNRFRVSMIDDSNEKTTILFRMIKRWSFLYEGFISKSNTFITAANFSTDKSVKLDSIEQKILQILSQKRNRNARNSGVTDQLRATGHLNSNWENYGEMNSFGAEFAFCKLSKCYHYFLDFKIPSKETGTDYGDVILPDQKIIDVKQTVYQTGKLVIEVRQASQYQKSKIDAFALMVGGFDQNDGSFSFRGFISKENLIQDFRRGYLNKIYDYIAKQSDLKSYQDMLNYKPIQIPVLTK